MDFIFEKKGKYIIIPVDERIAEGKSATINQFRDFCSSLVEQGHTNIYFDFGSIKYSPSIVFGNILSLKKKLEPAGGLVAIINPTDSIKRILNAIRIKNMIPIYDSEDDISS